jgi:tRNA (cytidine/uridine-2'-O-)-methyltransferase
MGFNLVLYEPEIPQNTANMMRSCLAFDTKLHLIEPLGFSLKDKYINRASANHAKLIEYIVYKNFDEFLEKNQGEFYYLTRYGKKNLSAVDVVDPSKEYYFILGKESTGIPYDILKANIDRCIRIPMTDQCRALNVSNAAAIILYEAHRQQGYPGLSKEEPENFKGSNFLLNQ